MTPDQLKALMMWAISLHRGWEEISRRELYEAFGFTEDKEGNPVAPPPAEPAQPELYLTGGDGRTHLSWSCPCTSCAAWRNTTGRQPPHA